MEWTLAKHDLLLPKPPPQAIALQVPSMERQDVRSLVRHEMGELEDTFATKGSRKMRPKEVTAYLWYAGLVAETPIAQCPSFLIDWEKTLIKDLENLEFGETLDSSNVQSHRGLSIATIWNMQMSVDKAADMQHEGDQYTGTPHKTREDRDRQLGKPGTLPNSMSELLSALDCYLIHLHAMIGPNGDHQLMVSRLRLLIQRFQLHTTLTQSQIDDIFWAVFRDSRPFFK